jgi:hypothetical protein
MPADKAPMSNDFSGFFLKKNVGALSRKIYTSFGLTSLMGRWTFRLLITPQSYLSNNTE